MKLFDSHCHLNDEQFDEGRDKLIPELFNSGIEMFINAGYSVQSSKKAIDIAKNYSHIYTTCGISPNDISDNEDNINRELKEIEEIAHNKKVVAIGEIGLDYYWNTENKDLQKHAFIKQIEIANKFELPIVIHTREAVIDTLDILKKNHVNKQGVFHCCPLNLELVKEALKLDFYISFAGPVTFKNSKNANEVISIVPQDKMLIETDSPYLAPEPKRGTRNDPRNVEYVARKIAMVKEIEVEEVARITYENACKLFEKIDKR